MKPLTTRVLFRSSSTTPPGAKTPFHSPGYFHFPYFNSLAEELLKTDGRGAVAAFSPSGLSLNGPPIVSTRFWWRRFRAESTPALGDVVLAAQSAYAESGVFPELLSIYHLLGDSAMVIP